MTSRRSTRRRRGQPKRPPPQPTQPTQPTPPQPSFADGASSAAAEESELSQPPHSRRPQPDHPEDQKNQHYDVCIVGAGPASLACLSAIMEQFSLDNMSDGQVTRAVRSLSLHRPRRVCVIDPHDDGWLSHWRQQFQTLGIDHLRSPALAHPHAYDQNALLAYAMAAQQHGGASANTDNNDSESLIESGIVDLKHLLPLGQAQIGLWKLPSTKLFEDFCLDTVRSLPHDFVRGVVTDVHKFNNDDNPDGPFQVIIVSDDHSNSHDSHTNDDTPPIQSTRRLTADAVILALGVAGAAATVPRALHECPPHRLVLWHQLDRLYDDHHHVPTLSSSSSSSSSRQQRLHYLVVGGGLTAAQVVLKICHDDPSGHVILCSRRTLMERHFDIPIAWFDRRTATKCLYDFYHCPVSERLALLKATKDGGSIPPIYMTRLRRLVQANQVTCLVGEAVYLREEEDEGRAGATITTKSTFRIQINENGATAAATVGMGDDDDDQDNVNKNDDQIYRFDKVIVACGTKPDCLQNPLVRNIYRYWPNIDICDGYPNVSADLQWTDRLYCVGSLGALHVGPDAANLMGMRRAALTIAQSLQCRGWLREKALTNPFAALFDDDDDDSSRTSEKVQDDVADDAISTSGSSDSSDL